MERILQVLSTANLDAIKEPRGFIRLIEFMLAIFAFASTTSPSSYTSFSVRCSENLTETITIPFYYPFNLHQSATFQIPICAVDGITPKDEHPYGDFTSSAQFYVFLGVMAFLYCLAIVILYTFKDDVYMKSEKLIHIDFFATIIFTIIWFISTCAWAQNLTDLKYYSSPAEIQLRHIPECSDELGNCVAIFLGNFSTLNVSIIFGFLNTFVWAFNLWFLFKETKWFSGGKPEAEVPSPSAPQQVPPISGSLDSLGLPA